jgi:16S rRNA processing protein RimM
LTPIPPEDHILIGKLGKTFQLEGGLRFYALGTREAEALEALERLFVTGLGERHLTKVRRLGKQQVVYLAGISSAHAAKALVNREVYAAKDALPALGAGEYYLDALIGLPVVLAGETIGEVVAVSEAAGHGLLTVERGGEEFLLPLEADYVRLSGEGVVLEDPPEGLLEL